MLVFSWEQDALANKFCSRTLVTRNYLTFKLMERIEGFSMKVKDTVNKIIWKNALSIERGSWRCKVKQYWPPGLPDRSVQGNVKTSGLSHAGHALS
jgi:hypothetical protein